MNIGKIYSHVSLDDLKRHQKLSDDDEIRSMIRYIIKEGLYDDKEELKERLIDSCCDYDELDKYDQILQEVIAEYRAEEQTWAKYTDCDILFVIVKEAAKIFPTLYHRFGHYGTPRDVLDCLEHKYPEFKWGEDKGDSTVIYISTDYRDNLHGDSLHLEIFNGYPEDRIKIRDYICDRLEEIKSRFRIIRDASNPGSLDQIKIHNFKWQFRYPPGFFDW